jgi:hypothetical protein
VMIDDVLPKFGDDDDDDDAGAPTRLILLR